MREKISIVVPCFNEERYIEICLLSLINSDYPQALIEILIIDGGSTDKSLSIIDDYIKRYPIIKVINNPRKITPVSLNIGIRESTGEYVMIASAHSQFPSNYISTLLLNLKKLNCDCIGGGINTQVINSTSESEAIVKILSSRFGVGNSSFRTEADSVSFVDTVPFGIYKKSLFEKVGYYNEKLVRNHDIEFSKRLIQSGYKIVLVASVRCIYYARETFSKLISNNFKNGVWNIRTFYITRRLRSLSIRHFVPLIFILSLILPIVSGLLINMNFLIISLLSFMTYSLFILVASLKLKGQKTKLLFILWGLFLLHFSYGLGSLTGLLRLDKFVVHQ